MQKLTRRSVLLGTTSLLFSSPAFAWGRFFGRGGAAYNPPSVALTCSPTTVSISTTQTGTVTTFTVGGGNPNSYTFSLSGTNASSFTLTGATATTVSLNVPTALTAGPYSFNLVATNTAGPATFPISVTASGAGLVTKMTVSNLTASTQTNVPVSFGLPLNAGQLAAGQKLVILDSDGVTQLAVQEDGRTTDLYGNVRFVTPTVVLPTLASNENRVLTINTISGSPASATDILASDILATAYDYQVTINHKDGNAYTASARTGLAAGTYSSRTSAATMGKWRNGGGLCTDFVVMVPLKTSGGTASTNLRCIFNITAYKAQTGAVSGPNPITSIRTDCITESGWIQSSPAVVDDWYGATHTSGSTTQSFPNSTPTQTLTIGSNTASTIGSLTASTSLFTANSIGTLVSDGTGYGVITGYTSGTVASISVFKAFASATLTSGGYTFYGINHPYGSRYRRRIWYSGLTVPQFSFNLGNPFTGTSGGPLQAFASSRWILNYATPIASTTNDTTSQTYQGTNPTGYQVLGSGSFTNSGVTGYAGNIQMEIGGTGERGEIGLIPTWDIGSLTKFDSTAPQVVFGGGGVAGNTAGIIGNADKANICPIMGYRDPSTGLAVRMDNGTDWSLSPTWGSLIAQPPQNAATTSITFWSALTNSPHMGNHFLVPYLLTGDWFWIDCLQMMAQWEWMNMDPNYTGTQLNRVTWYGQGESRGVAWGLRTLFDFMAVVPDAANTVLGWSQSHARTYLTNHWTYTGISGKPFPYSFPGSLTAYVNNTGPGKYFSTDGPRYYIHADVNWDEFWQIDYVTMALVHARDLGLLDSNGLATLAWAAEGTITRATDTTQLQPQYTVSLTYYMPITAPLGSVDQCTWSAIYQAWSLDPGVPYGNRRQLNGTMTLSALSGTAVQATMPAGNFGAGNWYIGGWVFAASGNGCGRITAVSGNVLTLDTTAAITSPYTGNAINGSAFTSLTYAANAYFVPFPAVGDPVGTEVAAYYASPGTDYYWSYWCTIIMLNDYGYTGASTALSAVQSWHGVWDSTYSQHWQIAAR